MKINIILIIFIGTYLSCSSSSNGKVDDKKENKKKEQISISQINTCNCFDGIGSRKGDAPISKFSFSNNQSIIICGYKEDEIISEFDIFNCKDGTSISQYDATQNCQVRFKKDTIEIIEIKNLPSTNWEWELISIGKELIILKDSSIESLQQKPFFTSPKISKKEQKEFLDGIEINKNNGLQQDWDWEEILAKLEVLSLMQNQRAKQILFSIQEMTNYKFDGAIREQYKDAVATVEWMRK